MGFYGCEQEGCAFIGILTLRFLDFGMGAVKFGSLPFVLSQASGWHGSDYFLHNIIERHGYINCKCIRRFFECIKLALEHLRFHIMISPFFHARPYQVVTTFEIDNLDSIIAIH